MNIETTGLEEYITKALSEIDHEPRFSERLFDYGITHRPPLLFKGRRNRILLYPGSFNPPHLGHMDLLLDGFARGEDLLNVIAAFIMPLDDNSLRFKLRGQPGTRIFSKAERVRLWQGHVPSDWCWVYPYSVDKWSAFKRHLTAIAEKDGFEIVFTQLCGSDCFHQQFEPPLKLGFCNELIVSGVNRDAGFYRHADQLTSLPGYQPWKKIYPDNNFLMSKSK